MTTRFERDTAVRRDADCRYTAGLEPGWWVLRGPNGGYLAAIILRALVDMIADDARAPRSLTVHFTEPPVEGDVTIRTAIERVGRSVTSCSARMHQGDRLIALAVAAFATPRDGPEFCDLAAPDVPPPDATPALPPPPAAPPITHRWDTRWVIGERPFEGPPGDEAVAGGWIRLEEPQPLDAVAVAAIADGWVPAVFSRTTKPLAVPTIDLTVHFRTVLPDASLSADGFLLAVFRTRAASGGFLEEDGEVWSPDGTLLAQSRQLAVILPL